MRDFKKSTSLVTHGIIQEKMQKVHEGNQKWLKSKQLHRGPDL